MGTPKFIKMIQGLDRAALPVGALVTDWPWTVFNSAFNASIVAGAGAYGGKALKFAATGTTTTRGVDLNFPGGGLFTRNNTTDSKGKAMFGFGLWIKPEVATNTAPIPGVFASINTSLGGTAHGFMSLFSASGTPTLAFPTNISTWASYYSFPVTLNTWYWVDVRFVVYPNAQLRASYFVNGIPVADNVAVGLTTTDVNTTVPVDLLCFSSGSTTQYSIDDVVIRAVSGGDSDWPAGFTNGVPNNPAGVDDMPGMTPRRITTLPLTDNGSVVQLTPSTGQNYVAAQTEGQNVTTSLIDATDLYKVSASAGLADINCIQLSGKTTVYTNSGAALKVTSAGAIVPEPGVHSSGPQAFISVVEQLVDGSALTPAAINAAEFGQKTL